MAVPIDQVTVDGYDMTWGTNTLGTDFLIVDEMACILSVFCNQLLSISRNCSSLHFSRPLLLETSREWSIPAPPPVRTACRSLVPASTLQVSRTLPTGESTAWAHCTVRVNWYVLQSRGSIRASRPTHFNLQGEYCVHPGIGPAAW